MPQTRSVCLPNSAPPISGDRVGHDVRAPDQREHRGELRRAERPPPAAAERHHHELEDRPERRDQQAVRAREHAVHDPRLRAVKRRRQKAVRVVEAEENPAGDTASKRLSCRNSVAKFGDGSAATRAYR